ncbi:hypothetical protein [Pseudorhodoplanes sinuspersici]|uniref:Uncharacterized protein n=1 Tax=Pseudorhodoplanes sinuspersici TaxID=1235591 RepID=A0A1W6ZQN5_9HYPH|nr:hypothetical protein [Pseudorhodoplanes sinuspersici]ARP99671.1 hypothetical protein CAK95_11675 [Pseudorhodoplanes sinuspersici]RKE70654.1 hypothetical protein DFP91_2895 [Pseudorhodoplanes sinuspersici]
MPATGPLYPHYFNARVPTKTRSRNRRTAEIPERAPPHVRLFFSLLGMQGLKYDEIEIGSGVLRSTQKSWKRKSFPSLTSLQSVFSFLGWDYVPVPSLEAMPGEISAELVKLARQIEADIPAVWRAAVAVGVEQALLNMSIAEKRAVLEARAANDNALCRRARKVSTSTD